jgi:hypothetical protein
LSATRKKKERKKMDGLMDAKDAYCNSDIK